MDHFFLSLFRVVFGVVSTTVLLLLSVTPSHGQLLDVWKADSLNLFDEGDAIGSWTSSSNRTATTISGGQPILIKNATPGGSSVLRFERNWMTVPESPVGGLKAFSMAMVFKAAAVGTNTSSHWYGKTGIVDADQTGTTADWGTGVDEKGRLVWGIGQPDTTVTLSGTSLVDSNYHIAVLTWGEGAQSIYLEDRPVSKRTSGISAIARNASGFSIGAIHTSDKALGRRFVGDLAELRFYAGALSPAAATNVIQELKAAYFDPALPIIRLFSASTNAIYVGDSVRLNWEVTNATDLAISPDESVLADSKGSIVVRPHTTTTYVLSATNPSGTKTAAVTVFVDPGIPIAHPQSVVTIRNAGRDVELSGEDPNGGSLTYAIATPPQHGTLSGTPPQVRYSPETDFSGTDTFRFVVNDGSNDSAPATVSIRVDPLPTAPTQVVLSRTNLFYPAATGSFVAALRTVDANPLDSHTYALVVGQGSRDNALFTLTDRRLFLAAPLTVQSRTNLFIRIRTTDSAGLSLEQEVVFVVAADASNVVLNEIHYNGANNTVPDEFIEIYNPRETAQDLSGWRLQGGVDFIFPPGSVVSGRGFIVVAQDPSTVSKVYSVQALGPWSGSLNSDGETVTLRNAQDRLVDSVSFRSEFPWPVAANGGGGSMELMNPSLDNDLGSSWSTGLNPAVPSPGRTNQVFVANPPPNLRQVNHDPQSPKSTESVTITVKVTDPEGVASVVLEYQVLTPGHYVPAWIPRTIAELNNNPFQDPKPNPEYGSNWVSVVMVDNGLQGDQIAGDDIYTVVLPPEVNRALVRYRITATDSFGASRRAPFEDDQSLNFAFFVYDGIPDYFGISKASLETLPVYFLITRAKDLLDCNGYDGSPQIEQFNGALANEARYVFNWPGAMVYDGEVYDNIRYRLRGANGRYQNGKRNMRFKFNDGRHFQARDLNGKKYSTKWASLNTGKGSSNRLTLTYGLNEILNYFLWSKVGVPTPMSHYFHFRVVQGVDESPDPYHGDFWGLSWAQENYDVRFLEAHHLPKGNLYKLINAPRSENILVDQQRQERYQAPFAVTNGADAFNIQQSLRGTQTSDWLLSYVNYSNWFRYHAVAEGVRHYDYWPDANKNAAWYFEPLYTPANKNLGRMWTFPWDTDSTWGPTWNSGYDAPYDGIFAVLGGTKKPQMIAEYQNVVREVRDLLFQPDQLLPIIDSFASQLTEFVPADLMRWSNAPSASNPKAVSEAAYRTLSDAGPGLSQGLPGYVADLKRFAFVGGSWPGGDVPSGGQAGTLDTVGKDPAIPNRPTIEYVGPAGFPLDRLVFRSSAFDDPQGPGTFASMRWRVAEVRTTNDPVVPPSGLKLELDAVWESPEITRFESDLHVPGVFLKAGARYRVRVRHQDTTGRWSRWSAPLEFIATPAEVLGGVREQLVVSEVMYHPSAPGELDPDLYEFIEFKNIGTQALDLTGVRLSGLDYAFPDGTRLEAGQTWLLVRDPVSFRKRYPGILFQGVFGGKLDNGGETIRWLDPNGTELGSFTYGDRAPWPVTADGLGFSLVLADPIQRTYRSSASAGGSPGTDDPTVSIPKVVINEILASASAGTEDSIELVNLEKDSVDIGGWWISDDPEHPKKFSIPAHTTLPGGGFWVAKESQFNAHPDTAESFALSARGDSLYLFSANSAGELTGYSHGWEFGGSPDGKTLGRVVNSVGEESLAPQRNNTLGALNEGPLVGDVVISEIHYHPSVSDEEFVEIYNRSEVSVALFDAAFSTNRWKLNGLSFTFAPGTQIAPKQTFVISKLDPEVFRARFALGSEVVILGPYAGSLQDGGEFVELLAPAKPGIGGVPYFAVDQVQYRDRAPWPAAADGSGASLHRVDFAGYGSDPKSWTAALPSPGRTWSEGAIPVIVESPQSATAVSGQTTLFSIRATGPGPLHYQWWFEGRPLNGATNSTLERPAVGLADVGHYWVEVLNPFGAIQSDTVTLSVQLLPRILSQPQSLAVRLGTNIQFSVTADSAFPLQYQWFKNTVIIPGATNSTLRFLSVGPTDQGDYRVRITDRVGTVTSAPASLVILIDPIIVQDPVGAVTVPGGSVTLSVQVDNTANLPITYRWKRGSTDLTGGQFTLNDYVSFITISNVLAPQTNFSVTVSNVARKTVLTSKVASVTLMTDSDKDGIPDEWERLWGFDSNLALDAQSDVDGDGQSNLQEFIAGTDPRNALSVLALHWQGGEQGQPVLEFMAVSNRTYTVESTEDLELGIWERLVDVVASPTSRIQSVADGYGNTRRFYRVVTPRRR